MRAFDAHFHIIDDRFPLISNDGYLPLTFQCEDYQEFQAMQAKEHQCEFIGGAVVSGSFQGYDKTYLLDALKQLGGNYVGVLQMDPCATVSDAELYDLNAKGIRAVRFNFRRGCCDYNTDDSLAKIKAFIHRIHEVVGWHAEFYLCTGSIKSKSSALFKLLSTVPKVVIDHLGMDVDESEEGKLGFGLLAELLQTGNNVFVKASGFGRLSADKDILVTRLQSLYAIRPEGLVFGSDMPGTRAREPFESSHIDVLTAGVGSANVAGVLENNGRRLYRMDDHQECFQGISWDPEHKVYALEVQEPFSQFLLCGQKVIETREYPLPHALQGCPILLLETNSGTPCKSSLNNSVDFPARDNSENDKETETSVKEQNESLSLTAANTSLMKQTQEVIRIIGAVSFSHCHQYLTEEMWRHDEKSHLVTPESPYDWSGTKKKFGWHVCETWTKEQALDHISSSKERPLSCLSSGNNNDIIPELEIKGERSVFPNSFERIFRSLFEADQRCTM